MIYTLCPVPLRLSDCVPDAGVVFPLPLPHTVHMGARGELDFQQVRGALQSSAVCLHDNAPIHLFLRTPVAAEGDFDPFTNTVLARFGYGLVTTPGKNREMLPSLQGGLRTAKKKAT